MLVFVLVLAGCNGGDDSASGDADATADDGAATEDAGTEEEGGNVEPASLTFVTAAAVIAAKEEVATYAVAQEMGYFEDEGLSVDVVTSDGSTAAIQAVASGSGQVTAADAGSFLAAAQEGVPVQTVGGLVINWPWRIAVPPDSEIQSPEDLDGRRIGIISLASGSNPYARAFVEAAGLDPESAVEYVPVGVGPQAASALDGGEVDALALYTQAYAVIENAGVELRYLDNPEVFEPLVSLTWGTTDDYLAENADVFERFLRASYKALTFSITNPEAAMRIGYEVFPELLADGASVEDSLEADVATLEAWLETTAPQEEDLADYQWGSLDDEQWSAVTQFAIDAGTLESEVPIEEVWTDEHLEAINDWDREPVLEAAETYEPPS